MESNDKKNIYKYKFSVVIPIYNVENYLEETMESVINQTIGFEENIQMILVNDGSLDNSEEICLKYKEKYPNNVVYIKQENSGVSAARNNGMKYIEGKYVNFLDSDDKWDLHVFERVWNFFENHYDEIDLVAGRLKFFEAKNNYHFLDYRFKKTKVVDIFEDYDFTQIHMAASFIKSEIFNRYKYNTNLKFSEDALLSAEIIMEKCKYGVVKEATYFYRKRNMQNSAIQSQKYDKEYYTSTIRHSYIELINKSIEKFGYVIEYIQYQLMYDIQWRMKEPIPNCIEDNISEQYINDIRYILKNIDDHIICEQRNIFSEYKILALCLKYGKDIRRDLVYQRGKLYFDNIALYNLENNALFRITNMKIEDAKFKIEGQINCILNEEDYKIYAMTNKNEKIDIELYDIHNNDRNSFIGIFLKNKAFKFEISVKELKDVRFIIQFKKLYEKRLNIVFTPFAKLTNNLKNSSYCVLKKYIITKKYNKLILKKNKRKLHLKKEYERIKELKNIQKNDLIKYRIMYFILKRIYKKREIWIFSDRSNVADDNGIHFWKYVNKQNNKKIKTYFAISKNCDDYKSIKKNGNVVKLDSFKYKVLFLLSSKIISSQAEDWVINAFGSDREYMKDLYNFKFVFLQHGITKDDLSLWLNKKNKNINLFVTSAQDEYNSIVNGKYEYSKEEVKLTGFPRYDTLVDNKKKQIVFMPTWRKSIAKQPKAGTSEREYDENFINTEYFKFYNSLINDEKIIKALKENGYSGKLCVHPSFGAQVKDFKGNDTIAVKCDSNMNYQKEFAENALMITDFSSVAFDFAYLNKPVIYTQFDADTFFDGQVYDKGYFDYENDAFGPICYDYETAVQTIVKVINNDCKLESKYADRINKFYAYHDRNNCKRVYEEILKLK